jgi:phospholipase A1
MKEKSIIGGIIVFIGMLLSVGARAQDGELRDILLQQTDTGKLDFRKPFYLEVEESEIGNLLDRQPSFGMYRDNYFITGIPTNKRIDSHSTDVKFQISIHQRLFKSLLPFNTCLLLTYTQKSFWNLYESSAPFAGNNYNPGLVLAKPLVFNNKLEGMVSLALEHESNGLDTTQSRSWEYFVLAGSYFFNLNFSIQTKLWAGWTGKNNGDLLQYRGYGLIAFNYRTFNDRFWLSAVVNPRKRLGDFNTQLELNFKTNPKYNQYFFLQWYQGYGENLMEYERYTSMVRVGFCIKPFMRNIY